MSLSKLIRNIRCLCKNDLREKIKNDYVLKAIIIEVSQVN